MPARPRVTIRCKGLAVTFEIALVLRKVKSTAITPVINMIAIRNETSRARDFMGSIVCWVDTETVDAAAITFQILKLTKGFFSSLYSALRADTTLVNDSFASPNKSVVLASYKSSFSMPAKPGRIDLFRKITFPALSTSRIGMP